MSRATIAKWKQHQTAKIYPPHLKSKVPQIQLSKEFREIVETKTVANTLDQKFKTFLANSLAKSLKAKQDELSFLRGALEP